MRRQKSSDFLFSRADWFSVQENQSKRMLEEIDQLDSNQLLNSPVEDWVEYFSHKFVVDVPVLHEDSIVVDQKEIEIDVRNDPNRWVHDRSQPFNIKGTAVEVEIPFEGEAEAFQIRPTQYSLNPPRAAVLENCLKIIISGPDLKQRNVKQEIDRALAEVREHLERLRSNADGLNKSLPQAARDRLQRRRDKLLADQNLVSGLGFPLKERSDAPRTYTAPDVRRRITPKRPPASTAPYKPEPVLDMTDYEHILSVLGNMATVMERSPSAFASMDEEALRSHFLVQLNGHYEGQATGETFNYTGKTDILIRSESKNIFIAECKYWAGPKTMSDTVDQLLGYLSWRDTKAAILVFNRNKGFSKVFESIQEAARSHPHCKRDLGKTGETSIRYVFAHRDDPNRETIITVMAFDVPSKT